MTISEARARITQELLRAYPLLEARVLAQHLLSWALNEPFSGLLASPQKSLSASDLTRVSELLKDHLEHHKPLQYCMGTVPFLSATIHVKPPILIPRPETEWWVDLMIGLLKKGVEHPLKLLDIGTGSGCIAIALAQAFPHASLYAVDCNPDALTLAQENAVRNGCTNITFIHSDLFENIPADLRFDSILSNPPYIGPVEYARLKPDVLLWEDPQALTAEEDGYALLTKIISEAPRWLTRDPHFVHIPQLALEIGHQQAKNISAHMHASGFIPTVYTDLAHKDRMVSGKLSDA